MSKKQLQLEIVRLNKENIELKKRVDNLTKSINSLAQTIADSRKMKLNYLKMSESKKVQTVEFESFDEALKFVIVKGVECFIEHDNEEFLQKLQK